MRGLLIPLVLVTVGLGGCLGETEADRAHSEREFEARLLLPGHDNWTKEPITYVMVRPLQTIAKAEPGPSGGGGRTFEVDVTKENLTIEVRLKPRAGNEGINMTWWLVPVGTASSEAKDPIAARGDQVVRMAIPGPGRYAVRYESVVDDGMSFSSSTSTATTVSIGFQASFVSAVHPVRPAGAPHPPNYGEMADVFRFKTASAGARLEARTSFHGNWTAPQGTDVDLELAETDGDRILCVGAGGGTTSSYPDVEQAREKIEVGVPVAEFLLRVGALSRSCGNEATYVNPANVPYLLTVRINAPS